MGQKVGMIRFKQLYLLRYMLEGKENTIIQISTLKSE